MKITVCVKRVPDTATRIRIGSDGRGIAQAGVKHVMSPYDEFAVEAALQLTEAAGAGQVTLLSHGPSGAAETLRSGLALGAHKGGAPRGRAGDGRMGDRAGAGLGARERGADLILFGVKAVDDDQQQVGPMVAELLNRPCATSVAAIDVKDGVATCRRAVEGGQEVVEVDLPAVATITKGRYEPRYASLRGIMMAKRKPLVQKPAPEIASALVVEAMELPPKRPADGSSVKAPRRRPSWSGCSGRRRRRSDG